ncbi:MAG: PocR ligand-binding domain-containing protein [Verrucomicrobiota bacterium]|jgi:ligand-binding sensor protein/predicted nucleotide-binding protein
MNSEHHQFSLLRFTSKEELSRIVQAFCDLTGLSGGVVAMPDDPSNPPTDEEQFEQYRLTKPGALNQKEFCRLVRSCSCGNQKCMWSDLRDAQMASAAGKAVDYRCHLGLVDIVAPVKVAGHHVANVYLGEIRPSDLDFETVWSNYMSLLKASAIIREQASKEGLKKAFDLLPAHSAERIAAFAKTTEVLAELISQRATRQAAVVVTLDAAHEIGASLNLHGNLSIYLRHALRLLNGNTGTIFLLDDNKQKLRLIAHAWPETGNLDLSMSVSGPGLAAKCAMENQRRYHGDLKEEFDRTAQTTSRAFIIRAGNRSDIDGLSEPLTPFSRDRRELQSLIVVPITCAGELLGVMDVGSSVENAYSADDELVLRLFAREVGLHARYTVDRQALLTVFAENDPEHLGRVLVREVPHHVRAIGCSILIREGRIAKLFATTEFNADTKEDVSYDEGEGLTGWVFKSGHPLNLQAGPKCRTENLPKLLKEAGVVWKGKCGNRYPEQREYWADRPFLAVPVRSARGEVDGVIRVSDRIAGSFTDDDQSMLQAFADCLGQVLRSSGVQEARKAARRPRHVFLGYGQNPDAEDSIHKFLNNLGLEVVTYATTEEVGEFTNNIVMGCIENSDAAVILYTGDDELKSGQRIARRNVAYELGVAHRAFGRKKTVLLLETGVEEPTNVAGMQVVRFERNCLSTKFADIRKYLEKMHLLD